jgi:DNA-directed RNA polymerase specialized sigma24 family protein
MTDPTRDVSQGGREVSPEAFARLLAALSPDAEEAGRLYTRLHQKLISFFQMRGLSDPGDAADDTLDRAAARLAQGAQAPDVSKYCLGIARNVARERWRREQREEPVAEDFVVVAAETGEDEEIRRIHLVLKPCLEQLAPEERELLVAYCRVARGRARAEHRRALADARQTTVLALRMRVTRLRSILTDCVRERSALHA